MAAKILKTKIVSSLEKAFADEKIEKYPSLGRLSALAGERISFQLLYFLKYKRHPLKDLYEIYEPIFEGELANQVTVRNVNYVPVIKTYSRSHDGSYLRTTPGLYPDLLTPLHYGGKFHATEGVLDSLWIDIDIPEDFTGLPDRAELKLSLKNVRSGEIESENAIEIEIIKASLPEQTLKFTQWFHCDCLANYYGTGIWSEEHWRIIQNFIISAARNGINTILTPLLTPSLDGPREITQLVKVTKKNGKYRFDFSRLVRWIRICDDAGIRFFEISHLFTQGGGSHTPRVIATVDGEEKMIFSYDTPSDNAEYRVFLRALMKAFVRKMKDLGADHRCIFHISDEPGPKLIEVYKKDKEIVADIIKDYPIVDALYHVEYYKDKIVEHPVCNLANVKDFLEAKVEGLWVYYCLDPSVKYSNRFIAQASWHNRSIGMQMFKYNIQGFLHWGYNFYNNAESERIINPFIETSAEKWAPAGDAFSVYPGRGGEPLESIREAVFFHALEDMRAMQLCESLYSHEEVVGAIEKELGCELTFERCARSAEEMLKIREKINSLIKQAIK